MENNLVYIVAGLAALAMIGVLVKSKPGWGPNSIRAFGLVFVVPLALIVGLVHKEYLSAAIGFIGAVVGYLFGQKSNGLEDK